MPVARPAITPRHTLHLMRGKVGATLLGLCLAGGMGLAACTQFPDLDDSLTEADENGRFPKLVPVETLLVGTEPVALQPDTQSTLEDRIGALNQRAKGLRDAGLDAETRERMQRGVTLAEP